MCKLITVIDEFIHLVAALICIPFFFFILGMFFGYKKLAKELGKFLIEQKRECENDRNKN